MSEWTILNVDDDEANRYAVSRLLRHAGYAVIDAETGEEALERAAEARPDLIVLDVQLPGIDGFEVRRRLRARPELCDIPIVHLTAHAMSPADRIAGLEGGAAAYLTRPLESRELVATISNLLAIRRAERQARRVAAEWQSTFDAIADALYVVAADGRVSRCNRAMLALSESVGCSPLGAPHEEVLAAVLGPEHARECLAAGPSTPREATARDRAYRWTAHDLHGDHGPGLVGVLADVTDRRALEHELQRRNDALVAADQRKDDFLAMLGHELRNPLGALRGGIAVLEQATIEPAPAARARAILRRQVEHLVRLVDDLLDVARITRGKIELQPEIVDLRGLAEHALVTAAAPIAARRHTVRVVHPPEPIPVHVDPMRIEQVIANLLDNAAKYTGSGGTIVVETAREGSDAVVRVRDDGIGIPPDRLDRVFEPFVQLEPTMDRAVGGLGIGLTLVRSIVELHGGRVTARSEGRGRGSEMEVRLAIASGSPPAE